MVLKNHLVHASAITLAFLPSLGVTQTSAVPDCDEAVAGDGATSIQCRARDRAQAFEDALAFALEITEVLGTSDAADTLTGNARSNGVTNAESRGVSVGVDFAEIEEENGVDVIISGENDLLIGELNTRNGDDLIRGVAETTVESFNGDGSLGEIFFAGANGIIVDRNSRLNTGPGNDTIRAKGSVTGQGIGENDENEIIADGFENVGFTHLGQGDDTLVAEAEAVAIGGLKAIADGFDTSSVGNPNVNAVQLNLGAGNDVLKGTGIAIASGDAALGNGGDNRAVLDAGSGDDRIVLRGEAFFTAVDIPGFTPDQPEAIADCQENRGQIFLGAGNDRYTGVSEGIADGGDLVLTNCINNRGEFFAGQGEDFIKAESSAFALQDGTEIRASGILNENAGRTGDFEDAGDFDLGNDNDRLLASTVAVGQNGDIVAAGFANISTDLPQNATRATLLAGLGDDRLDVASSARGTGNVFSVGLFGGATDLGPGDDLFIARADVQEAGNGGFQASSAVGTQLALAIADVSLFSGVAVGIFNADTQGGLFQGKSGNDTVRVLVNVDQVAGNALIVGILGNDASLFNTGDGEDEVIIRFDGSNIFAAAEQFGIFGGTIELGGGADVLNASRFGIANATVNAGGGNDTIQAGLSGTTLDGRSTHAVINGGGGDDTLILVGSSSQFDVDDTDPDNVLITRGGNSYLVQNVETIDFTRD